jgi:serine/threonine protein kinase
VADFKTALEALADGKLDINLLVKQLDKLLRDEPKFAHRMLTQLDEIHDNNRIDDNVYATLKRQINQYRRAHAAATETTSEKPAADSTVFAKEDNFTPAEQPAADDSTRSSPDMELPDAAGNGVTLNTTQNSDIDFDLSLPDSNTATPSLTSATGPAGTDWQQPQPAGYQPGRELGSGDVIKERFKLIEVLGIGGMGKVYKGIDLLKEEARDKNPYVAIKLLNEDFKSHPEAFISLQRESSRQQKLAHPNIATVYDFDRIGGPGTPVFITMELMEGQDLSTYIKRTVRKQGGLPFPEAFNLTRQLAAALEYAHERRLVHSDFKPGNAFLCNDGTVKTLDFGIARAVKNPVTGETEKTLFDPSKLGALTPAYASLEMLNGEEPDTRDDTYALGCVAYELLTGKHPFNKLPATTAMENGLVPPYVKTINKKSNRALRRAVAFHRKDRSPSVKHFIEEFEGKATWYKNPFAIAAGIILIIGLITVNPALNYLHDKKIEEFISQINSGDRQSIRDTLVNIRTLNKVDQTAITTDAQEAIQNYFSTEINNLINISADNYNFPRADAVLTQVQEFYPGSLFLEQQRDTIEFNRRQKISDLYNDYIAALNDADSIDTTRDILNIIREQINPSHSLLTDPRPANAYRLLADSAFQDGDYTQALELITSALETAPDDARLLDLQNKIQQAVRIAALNETLGNAEQQLVSLDDFKPYQSEIIELSNLSQEESPLLASLTAKLRTAATNELATILAQGNRADAESLTEEVGELLSTMQLGRELAQIKLAHLTGSARTQAIQEMVDADAADIATKLAAPDIDNTQWESELLASVRELDSLTEEDPGIEGNLQTYREQIAGLYINRADEILDENRFDAATALVNRGLRLAPDLASLRDALTRIQTRNESFDKDLRVAGLKDDLKIRTDSDDVNAAEQSYQQLRAELGANDSYLSSEARPMLASSYARLSQRRKDTDNNEDAYRLAIAGLEHDPNNATLISLRDETRVDVYIAELNQLFQTASSFDVEDVREKVRAIETSGPDKYPDFLRNAESALAGNINRLNQTDPEAAGQLAIASSNLFPSSSTLSALTQGVSDVFAALENDLKPGFEALAAANLSAANRIIQQFASRHTGQPRYITLQQQVENRMREANTLMTPIQDSFDTAKQVSDRNQRRSALVSVRNDLNKARDIWKDNTDINKTLDEINLAIAGTQAMQREREIALDETVTETGWAPIASDRPCTTSLAGYGSRSRAVCYDFVNNGWRGPQLVVIPAGGEVQNPFAIGRYELSVGDWAKYCALSGNCKPETNTEKHNDPLTGVTRQQIEEYLQWLSDRTGKTYRLPSKTEWAYAANANGDQPRKDVNCRVELQGKLLKGTGITSVTAGQANGWGLKNYVGNVREIVMDGNAFKAAGGGFSDAHSDCDISLEQTYSGNPDEATGFRVLVEDVSG